MITAFCIVAFVAFLFLSIIWNGRDDVFNLMLKVGFALMAAWAFVCVLVRFGFHT